MEKDIREKLLEAAEKGAINKMEFAELTGQKIIEIEQCLAQECVNCTRKGAPIHKDMNTQMAINTDLKKDIIKAIHADDLSVLTNGTPLVLYVGEWENCKKCNILKNQKP
ncbi:MAG TPA: hypothetical protein PLM68_06840 [Bacteroidales bacterium]|nr:hypothetical protein [Bacteroidales bacterium]